MRLHRANFHHTHCTTEVIKEISQHAHQFTGKMINIIKSNIMPIACVATLTVVLVTDILF